MIHCITVCITPMYSTGVGTYRIIRLLPKLKENTAEVEVPPLEGVAQHTALS